MLVPMNEPESIILDYVEVTLAQDDAQDFMRDADIEDLATSAWLVNPFALLSELQVAAERLQQEATSVPF